MSAEKELLNLRYRLDCNEYDDEEEFEMDISLRYFETSDIPEVLNIIDGCSHLEAHSPFIYWILSNYFTNLSVVAISRKKVVGFASAILSSKNEKLAYLWQVGVDSNFRRNGIGNRLIEEMFINFEKENIRTVEFSIPPSNLASLNMLKKALSKSNYKIIELEGFSLSVENIKWEEIHRHFVARTYNEMR